MAQQLRQSVRPALLKSKVDFEYLKAAPCTRAEESVGVCSLSTSNELSGHSHVKADSQYVVG